MCESSWASLSRRAWVLAVRSSLGPTMLSMICIAALTHCSFVTWLTKSPLRYRFIARTGSGVGVASGTSCAIGVRDGSGDGVGVGAGVGVGVGRAVGDGVGGGVPVIAATSPVGWPAA